MNHLLIQAYQDSSGSTVAILAFFTMMRPIFYAIGLITIISQWIIFRKAGYQGWEAIIPIYSSIILLKIVGKPWWWIFLYLLLFVFGIGLIWFIWTINMLSKSFGKDEGFTIGLILLGFIFYPILAFNKNIVYQGPFGDKAAYEAYRNQHTFDFENKQ